MRLALLEAAAAAAAAMRPAFMIAWLPWFGLEGGDCSRIFLGSGGRASSSLDCGGSVMMVTTAVLGEEPGVACSGVGECSLSSICGEGEEEGWERGTEEGEGNGNERRA